MSFTESYPSIKASTAANEPFSLISLTTAASSRLADNETVDADSNEILEPSGEHVYEMATTCQSGSPDRT